MLEKMSHFSKHFNLDQKNKIDFKIKYDTFEGFYFLTRGMLGINLGYSACQQYSDVSSPFLDIDFLNYCFTIPLELRMKHQLYYKWILKKHPYAANYVYDRLNAKINEKQYKVLGTMVPKSRVPKFLYVRLLKKVNLKKAKTFANSIHTKNHMNPFEYWYNTSPTMRNTIDRYFDDNIHLLSDIPELMNYCSELFRAGNCIDKMTSLTLISMIKMYFTKEIK